MIIDARSVSSGTVIETEVCIVGAGVAGIVLARDFSDSPFRVALLENDGMASEQDTQDLYETQSIGLPLENSRVSRLRFFGGTMNHRGE
jgi:2-polyprenyl-6-methoxyphenol hydroxylase-like FAD-dependent oxidoreductase